MASIVAKALSSKRYSHLLLFWHFPRSEKRLAEDQPCHSHLRWKPADVAVPASETSVVLNKEGCPPEGVVHVSVVPTSDGYFGRPLGRSVKDTLLYRLLVARMALNIHAKHFPEAAPHKSPQRFVPLHDCLQQNSYHKNSEHTRYTFAETQSKRAVFWEPTQSWCGKNVPDAPKERLHGFPHNVSGLHIARSLNGLHIKGYRFLQSTEITFLHFKCQKVTLQLLIQTALSVFPLHNWAAQKWRVAFW